MNYGRMSEWDRGDRGGDTGAGAQAPERSVDTRSADFNGYGLRDLSGHRKKVRSQYGPLAECCTPAACSEGAEDRGAAGELGMGRGWGLA